MLKSELILPRLKRQGDEIIPIFLPSDYHAINIAHELIQLVRVHLGRRRGELEHAVKIYEGKRLDYPIIRGLFNILENQCIFSDEPTIQPIELRRTLFSKGPITFKPDLLSSPLSRTQAIAETATQWNLTSLELETALFGDLLEERILLSTGTSMTPVELINRYNLEVARGVLYWAREVHLMVHDSYKGLFKYIKLFKLMHTIFPNHPTGYHILLHGPISPFVKSTIRYGLQFAKFFPALLLCQNWHMEAEVHPPDSQRPLRYLVDEKTTLQTHFKASKFFDSRLEEDFAHEFEKKYTGKTKRKWKLAREDEIIVLGDTLMIPDFSLTHQDGRRALIEIIGFWHPQYLQRKLKKIRQAQRRDLLLLVYKNSNLAEEIFKEEIFKEISVGEVLIFTRKPILKQVLLAAERCAITPITSIED